MAKMKWGSDVNWRELNNAEYTEDDGGFEAYDGPMPPANTVLEGNIEKMWATESSTGNKMIKVLFVANENAGEKKKYNGCQIWENVLFSLPQMKWKWQPWLDALGISLRDLKDKTLVEDEESNQGYQVIRIGTVKFAKPFPVRVKTKLERDPEYGTQVRAGKFLPPAVEDDDDEDYDDSDDEDGDDPF
jgi:hypothetical protein